MAKVVLVIATTQQPQPTGQKFGGKYLFKIGDHAQLVDQPQADFGDLPDGSYSASVQSVDTAGAPIADLQTYDFVVATPGSGTPPSDDTYPAPSSLTAQITY